MLGRAPLFLTAVLFTACGGADGEVSFRFPDEITRSNATSVAVTIFEPLRQVQGGDIELITCDRVSTFPATRKLNIDDLELDGLGRQLAEPRRTYDYPLDEDLDLDFEPVPVGDQSDPWGLAMVVIEARAVVRSSDPDKGSPIATIAAGCTCFAAREARASDARLDGMVKTECPTLEEQPDRMIELKPILPKGFRIEPCTQSCSTAIEGGAVGGAVACISKIDCLGSNNPDCFNCPDCLEEELSNVPILFTSGDQSEILLSTEEGRIETQLAISSCTEGQTISTRVLGRTAPDFEQKLTCVDPIVSFDCTDAPLANHASEIVAVGSLARTGIVLLYDAPSQPYKATVDVYDPRALDRVVSRELPGRRALGVHAYQHDTRMPLRPLIAVATTAPATTGDQVQLDLFDWTPTSLEPQGSVPLMCPNNNCAEMPCAGGVRATNFASISTADIDGDAFNDIAVVGDNQSPLMVGLLSSRAEAGQLYSGSGCTCGQYAHPLNLVELGEFGGALGGKVDALLATIYGPYVRFGDLDRILPNCGTPSMVALSQVVRDITKGNFSCDMDGPPELICGPCGQGADAVIVGGEQGGARRLDVQVVFGMASDAARETDDKATLKIDPKKVSNDGAHQAETGDFNGDGADDLALLFAAEGEAHVWLGARNGALARSPVFAGGSGCSGAKMAVSDFDGDGISEIALICNPTTTPLLRHCVPRLTQP